MLEKSAVSLAECPQPSAARARALQVSHPRLTSSIVVVEEAVAVALLVSLVMVWAQASAVEAELRVLPACLPWVTARVSVLPICAAVVTLPVEAV